VEPTPHGRAVRGVPGAGGPLMASRYIANTPDEAREMLRVIGAASVEELLVKIPPKARLSRPLALPPALAETDLIRHLKALADAALMAKAATERTEVVISRGVNPLYRRVTATYYYRARLREAGAPGGTTDLASAVRLVGPKTAALVVQSPNFYGCLEDIASA